MGLKLKSIYKLESPDRKFNLWYNTVILVFTVKEESREIFTDHSLNDNTDYQNDN